MRSCTGLAARCVASGIGRSGGTYLRRGIGSRCGIAEETGGRISAAHDANINRPIAIGLIAFCRKLRSARVHDGSQAAGIDNAGQGGGRIAVDQVDDAVLGTDRPVRAQQVVCATPATRTVRRILYATTNQYRAMDHPRRRQHRAPRRIQLGNPGIALDVGETRQRHRGEDAEDDDDDDEFDHGEAALPGFHVLQGVHSVLPLIRIGWSQAPAACGSHRTYFGALGRDLNKIMKLRSERHLMATLARSHIGRNTPSASTSTTPPRATMISGSMRAARVLISKSTSRSYIPEPSCIS